MVLLISFSFLVPNNTQINGITCVVPESICCLYVCWNSSLSQQVKPNLPSWSVLNVIKLLSPATGSTIIKLALSACENWVWRSVYNVLNRKLSSINCIEACCIVQSSSWGNCSDIRGWTCRSSSFHISCCTLNIGTCEIHTLKSVLGACLNITDSCCR